MQTQFPKWLSQLAADGMDAELPSIVRGEAYSLVVPLPGDLSAEEFAFTVRLSPDAPVLETGSATPGAYNGTADETPVTLALTLAQVGNMPGDDNADGLAEVVFELAMAGKRISAGIIPISGEA